MLTYLTAIPYKSYNKSPFVSCLPARYLLSLNSDWEIIVAYDRCMMMEDYDDKIPMSSLESEAMELLSVE